MEKIKQKSKLRFIISCIVDIVLILALVGGVTVLSIKLTRTNKDVAKVDKKVVSLEKTLDDVIADFNDSIEAFELELSTLEKTEIVLSNYVVRKRSLEYSLNIVNKTFSVCGYTEDIPANLVIPSEVFGCPVVMIEDNAFYGCANLETVTIPSSIKVIEHNAFELCSSLSSVTLPNELTILSGCAFAYCESLTSLVVPNSVTELSLNLCFGLFNLTSLKLPAWANGTDLTFLDIPVGCTVTYWEAE